MIEIPAHEKPKHEERTDSRHDDASEHTHSQIESTEEPEGADGDYIAQEEKSDVWIVDWEGPEDPQNPKK